VQQVSYGPLIMSIMLIMSCYTGFFNVRRVWQSLNTGPRFYLRLIRRTGWLWISTSRTTDGRPFKPTKLSVPFLYPGVPAGLYVDLIFKVKYFQKNTVRKLHILCLFTFHCASWPIFTTQLGNGNCIVFVLKLSNSLDNFQIFNGNICE
jgi:hypothetical protein